jgi:hypothetical protein
MTLYWTVNLVGTQRRTQARHRILRRLGLEGRDASSELKEFIDRHTETAN